MLSCWMPSEKSFWRSDIKNDKNNSRRKRRNGEDMSETHAKFIKFLSAFLGAIGAAVCIILALTVVSETSAKVLLLVLAAVFLRIVYPMY